MRDQSQSDGGTLAKRGQTDVAKQLDKQNGVLRERTV